MTQLHPVSSAVCLATAFLVGGISLYAEPRAIDVPAKRSESGDSRAESTGSAAKPAVTQPSTVNHVFNRQPPAPAVPSAECGKNTPRPSPGSYTRRTLVILTFNGCPYCRGHEEDLDKAGVPLPR